jgi:PKD repeat protein
MKTIIRKSILAVLAVVAMQARSQTINICGGTSTIVTATNNSVLTNPTFSLNPGGVTSTSGVFTVSPSSSVVYTMYTTGTNTNSSLVTTTNTLMVNVSSVTYTLIPNPSFTLVCGTNSATVVQVNNVQTFPIGGGAVSFTFLPPGFSNTLLPGVLSSQFSNTITLPGVWNVVVRDNNTGCDFPTSFTIVSNITPPVISNLSISHTVLTCSTPTALIQVAQNAGLTYNWLPWSTQGHSVIVNTNTSAPTQTLLTTPTLVVTDNLTSCVSTTSFPVFQNIFPPLAYIGPGAMPPPFACNAQLTNQSSTGIPCCFPTNSLVVAELWEGPSPQTPATLTSYYWAKTSGVYTLHVKDYNNGCTSTALWTGTFAASPVAAFVHTVSGGQSTFNDASSGTNINTTYFWDFGDGTSSTLQNPTHTYGNGGAHIVKLKIKNSGDCIDSVSQSVVISGLPCTANSNFSLNPTGTPQSWNVIPSYPWNVVSARWDWGDGSSSNTLYTSHQYSAAGLYQICLSVTVSCASTSSTCTTYSVYRTSQQALIISVNVIKPDLVSGLTSNDPNAEFTWNIFPNPNAGNFDLKMENISPAAGRVVISDLSGRKIHEQLIDSDSTTVSIQSNNLSAGMYFVTLETDKIKVTKRMVVNR